MKPRAFDPGAWRGRKVTVLGLGRSGVAAGKLLKRRGFKVFGSDAAVPKSKENLPFRFETGGHSARALDCAFAVKSPGIDPRTPVFAALKRKRIPVFSEVEIALGFAPGARWIGVTGTNGKSTTTAWIGDMLDRAKIPFEMGGNLGRAACACVEAWKPGRLLLLELSSYQLADSKPLRPEVAVLLNIGTDHLGRHRTAAAYANAKKRVFSGQGAGDSAIFNADDSRARAAAASSKGVRLAFSAKGKSSAAARGGARSLRLDFEEKPRSLPFPGLLGAHNLENALAASLAARSCGAPWAAVESSLRRFKGLEHRFQDLGRLHGVRWIDDSKATNVGSALRAAQAVRGERVHWILGGEGKGESFEPLRRAMKGLRARVYTIGSESAAIGQCLSRSIPVLDCGDLRRAVEEARRNARRGEVILLSPACASFDQFPDFEARGRAFKRYMKRGGRP